MANSVSRIGRIVLILAAGCCGGAAQLPQAERSYQGREPDAAWREAAAARINKHRKAELRIHVTDANGAVVPDANVRVRMRRHAFGFGAAVTARMLSIQNEDGDRFRAIVARHFNKVVLENDLKWPSWETSKSNTHARFRRQWTDKALAWLADHDIRVRGHFVSWAPLGKAPGLGPGPVETVRERLFAHMEEELPAVGRRVAEWDAINHIAGWGETLEDRYGTGIYADIVNRARKLAPHARMWVNEGQILPGGTRRDDYERLIRYLVDNGAAPDGIGMMGHFRAGSLTAPAEVFEVLDRFAAIIQNLQLTELDVDTTGEQLQADYLRDIMTVGFSHPAMEAIVMWGFWEGRHWRPDAALWRRDWSIKPIGKMWLDLVFNQWWTDEQLRTGAGGNATLRGFLGDYSITAGARGAEQTSDVSLGREGLRVDLKLNVSQ